MQDQGLEVRIKVLHYALTKVLLEFRNILAPTLYKKLTALYYYYYLKNELPGDTIHDVKNKLT